MGVIQTSDYSDLTNHLIMIDEVFNDAQQQAVDKQIGLQIFDTKQNKNRNDTIKLNHGMGGVTYIPENTDYPEATGSEGDKITFTKYKYGVNVIITYESRLYDEYDEIESNVRTVVDEGYNKIDQSLADVLLNGFSSTSYTDVFGQTASAVGPDALALFSASHTNTTTSATYSNIITDNGTTNPAFARTGVVETRVRGLRYKDPQGVTRPIYYDTILVAPELEDYAERTINSVQVAGSANNDTNKYLQGKMKILAWPKLSLNSAGTDTSAYWFMYDSSLVKKTLKAFFAAYPTLLPPAEYDPNKNWNYLFHFIFSRGFSWAPYIMGSNAALS